MRIGDRVQLTAVIGPPALRLDVEIRRLSIGRTSPQGFPPYYVGATFSGSSAVQRAMLAAILKTR